MTLNIYKDMLDKMNLTQAAIEFVRANEHRQRVFGYSSMLTVIISQFFISIVCKVL